jgi:hypothetical protein
MFLQKNTIEPIIREGFFAIPAITGRKETAKGRGSN